MRRWVGMVGLLACLALAGPALAQGLAPDLARRVAEPATRQVLDALVRRDFARLAAFVGPEGLIVSPYVMLHDGSVRLSPREVRRCGRDSRRRLWGHSDGSGDPIRLTCRAFMDRFVRGADYRAADEVLYNDKRQRGLEPNNNHELGADTIVVEFHIRERMEEGRPYRPWSSLRLVFRRSGPDALRLIALTRDVRTI